MVLSGTSCAAAILGVALAVALATAAGCGSSESEHPYSPAAIVTSLATTHGAKPIEDLAMRAEERNADPKAQQALLARLDRTSFEHAWFLDRFATWARSPSVELHTALETLAWPEVPASWDATQRTDAYMMIFAARADSGALVTAQRRIATRLWPSVSQEPPYRFGAEEAERSPIGPLVAALTKAFDLRVKVVASGTEEIAAASAGRDVVGQPITALAYKDIRPQVERSLSSLVTESIEGLHLGFVTEAGPDPADAPATVEARYTVTRLDRLYEAVFSHAYGVRLNITVTVQAGGESWSSGDLAYEPDDRITFDLGARSLPEAVLGSLLDRMQADVKKALTKEGG